MRYDNPELRERLAGEYVLGTMPAGARQRFERLMRDDATLASLVASWEERLAPLDETAPPIAPPTRVWQGIERRIAAETPAPAAAPLPARGWLRGLAFWQGLAASTAAACAALILYLIFAPTPRWPTVVAVLSGNGGQPSWIAFREPGQGEVAIAAIRSLGADTGHSLQLWGLGGGAPKPLGLLPRDAARSLSVAVGAIPTDGALAVSLEPPGGSPTGAPTGPVLYQGKVLPPP